MKEPQCAHCLSKPCKLPLGERSRFPSYCPIINFADLVQELKDRYREESISPFYLSAALTEKECYDPEAALQGRIQPLRTRIRELAAFAEKIGARKLGLAFCSGLSDEAGRAADILERHGLEIVSLACSCGAMDKADLGVPPEHKIYGPDRYEAACNPLLQAEILNRSGTAFNIIIGLCVGHDMLFTKHSKAPVTTLIVKDRLTGHNPVISLYSRYHKDLV
jgi:uncharacterized metal-binding protein